MAVRRLTTTDNPFDPFTQWDEWYAFDTQAGHHTCGLLARFTDSSDDLSDAEESDAIDAALDEIVKEHGLGNWKIVESDIEN